MPGDPFYHSALWRRLRAATLARDGHRCTTPGCGGTRRLVVDHIVPRRQGGPDVLANLRTLCAACHEQSHHRGAGGRRQPRARGCDAAGWPLDPTHPWRCA